MRTTINLEKMIAYRHCQKCKTHTKGVVESISAPNVDYRNSNTILVDVACSVCGGVASWSHTLNDFVAVDRLDYDHYYRILKENEGYKRLMEVQHGAEYYSNDPRILQKNRKAWLVSELSIRTGGHAAVDTDGVVTLTVSRTGYKTIIDIVNTLARLGLEPDGLGYKKGQSWTTFKIDLSD